jgi:hypothetical protein
MTLLLDVETGAQALFDRTFRGTLFQRWEDQPEAFKTEFRETAAIVACATVVDPADEPGDEPPAPEPETGD